jgi:hypothetical protein
VAERNKPLVGEPGQAGGQARLPEGVTAEEIERYRRNVETTNAHAGLPEIFALCRFLRCRIIVHQFNHEDDRTSACVLPNGDESAEVIHLYRWIGSDHYELLKPDSRGEYESGGDRYRRVKVRGDGNCLFNACYEDDPARAIQRMNEQLGETLVTGFDMTESAVILLRPLVAGHLNAIEVAEEIRSLKLGGSEERYFGTPSIDSPASAAAPDRARHGTPAFDGMVRKELLAYLMGARRKGKDGATPETETPLTIKPKATSEAHDLKTRSKYKGLPISKVDLSALPPETQKIIADFREIERSFGSLTKSRDEIEIRRRLGADYTGSGRDVTPKGPGRIRSWHDNEEGQLPRHLLDEEQLQALQPFQLFFHRWFSEEFSTGLGFQHKQTSKQWREDISTSKDRSQSKPALAVYLSKVGVPFVEINAAGWRDAGVARLVYSYAENCFYLTATHYKPFTDDYEVRESVSAAREQGGHNTFFKIVEPEPSVTGAAAPVLAPPSGDQESPEEQRLGIDNVFYDALMEVARRWSPDEVLREEPSVAQDQTYFAMLLRAVSQLERDYHRACQGESFELSGEITSVTESSGQPGKAKPKPVSEKERTAKGIATGARIETISPDRNRFTVCGVNYYVNATTKGNNYIIHEADARLRSFTIVMKKGQKYVYTVLEEHGGHKGNYSTNALKIGRLREILLGIIDQTAPENTNDLTVFLAAFLAEPHREPRARVSNMMALAGLLGAEHRTALGDQGVLPMAAGSTWLRSVGQVAPEVKAKEIAQAKQVILDMSKTGLDMEKLMKTTDSLRKKDRNQAVTLLANRIEGIITQAMNSLSPDRSEQ